MPIKIDVEECVGCGACQDFCPVECIMVDEVASIMGVDECTECGACVEECPMECISMSDSMEFQEEWAGWKDLQES